MILDVLIENFDNKKNVIKIHNNKLGIDLVETYVSFIKKEEM
jgi:hypothetical protein